MTKAAQLIDKALAKTVQEAVEELTEFDSDSMAMAKVEFEVRDNGDLQMNFSGLSNQDLGPERVFQWIRKATGARVIGSSTTSGGGGVFELTLRK